MKNRKGNLRSNVRLNSNSGGTKKLLRQHRTTISDSSNEVINITVSYNGLSAGTYFIPLKEHPNQTQQ